MKRLSLIVLLAFPLFADEQGLRTENRTGEWWGTISVDEKYIYITGLRDGALLGGLYAIPRSDEKNSAECRSETQKNFRERSSVIDDWTVAIVAKRLDSFYADKANAHVIVPMALFYLTRVVAGDPPQKLRDLLTIIRQNDG